MTKRLNSKHKVDRRLKVIYGSLKAHLIQTILWTNGQTKSAKPSDWNSVTVTKLNLIMEI